MRASNKTAAARTGFLFNPGDEAPLPDPVTDVHDGITLRVVRWKILSERPCLVRCDNGEKKIDAIRALTTLCGQSCEHAMSAGKRAAADKEGYCNACLSLAGRGVIR